jgi:hypothetical protein
VGFDAKNGWGKTHRLQQPVTVTDTTMLVGPPCKTNSQIRQGAGLQHHSRRPGQHASPARQRRPPHTCFIIAFHLPLCAWRGGAGTDHDSQRPSLPKAMKEAPKTQTRSKSAATSMMVSLQLQWPRDAQKIRDHKMAKTKDGPPAENSTPCEAERCGPSKPQLWILPSASKKKWWETVAMRNARDTRAGHPACSFLITEYRGCLHSCSRKSFNTYLHVKCAFSKSLLFPQCIFKGFKIVKSVKLRFLRTS